MPEDPATQNYSFESAWADLAQRLLRTLVADGVARPLAEDVVQDTGVRLFQRWDRLDTTVSLMPLALTIARNLVVDHHRKHERVELSDSPQQEVVAFDVEERALARIHLSAVHRTFRQLNPRYRSLLMAEAGYAGHAGAGGATRTARTRARQALKLLMERAPDAAWGLGPIVSLYRRSAHRIKRLVERPELATMGQVAAAAALLFVASLPTQGAIAGETPAGPGGGRLASASATTDARSSRTYSSEAARVSGSAARHVRGSVPATDPSGGAGGTVLPEIARSKGNNSSGGSLGLHGFDETGQGTGTVAGEELDWDYHAEYQNPECVTEAAEGNASPGCDASAHAEGDVSVRHRDREVSAGTPGGGRSTPDR